MEVLYPRCAGLDVHKDSVVACARLAAGPRVEQEVDSFGTTTGELERLRAWLRARGVTHVAMEATGVYWKPVWHVLDGVAELVLANAEHVKNVPGRKTDVADATWLADLLAHGLIRASFVPARALRTLTRTRKQLVREKTQHVQRIEKTLQDANLKLSSVLSDIMGESRRALLEIRETQVPVIPVLLPGGEPALGFLGLNTCVDLRGLDDVTGLSMLVAAIRGQPPDFQERLQATLAGILSLSRPAPVPGGGGAVLLRPRDVHGAAGGGGGTADARRRRRSVRQRQVLRGRRAGAPAARDAGRRGNGVGDRDAAAGRPPPARPSRGARPLLEPEMTETDRLAE
jgi:transposase